MSPKKPSVSQEERALQIADSGKVRRHVFSPSQTEVWTVVGSTDEYVQHPESLMCTCPASFFRRIRGDQTICYHARAVQIAKKNSTFVTISENDSDIPSYIKKLLSWSESERKNT